MATITRELLKSLRPEIDLALAVVAKQHGLKSLHLGNAKFDPNAGTFTFQLNGLVEGGLGKEAALYLSPDAKWLGLPALGTEFASGAHRYKTTGLNSTGTKVLCQRLDDGKTYLFRIDAIKRHCPTVAVPA